MLQSSSSALSFTLAQLSETLHAHESFFQSAHVYPLTNYPGHKHGDLLVELLRKKLQPDAEAWIDAHSTKSNGPGSTFDSQPFKTLWDDVSAISKSIVRPMLDEGGAFADDFTIAEREAGVEKVKTGLRRELEADEASDDGDDDDDKMDEDSAPSPIERQEAVPEIDPALPPLSLEAVLRFVSTGKMPPGVTLNEAKTVAG